jgi:hypothetical protein
MGHILLESIQRAREAFLERAVALHNNKYIYDIEQYKNTHTKIKISCPIHGDFLQTPSRHLNSKGCNKCRISESSSLEVFLSKAKKVHGDKYDYSKVRYISNDVPVTIICRKHGEFETRPRSHTSSKSECPKCRKKNELTPIERAKIKFQNKFEYNGESIICPKHGNTGYTIHAHLKTEHGCRLCYEESRRVSREEYLSKVISLHGDKYDYSLVDLKNVTDNITIICPEHGEYIISAGSHLYEAKGCRKCSHKLLSMNEFIERSKRIHCDRYDYSLAKYLGIDEKLEIICPEHGPFWQRPSAHMQGSTGCKRCHTSKLQNVITEYISQFGIYCEICNRSVIKPLEIDIYVPDFKLGIEVHGNYFHSYSRQETIYERNKHKIKADKCDETGIRLLQFYEHEIMHKIEIVKSIIEHHLKKSQRIAARKCQIAYINNKEATDFFESSHINGHVPSTLYIALKYNNSLVTAMSMTKKKSGWEITRYASQPGIVIQGGFQKMLSHFVKSERPRSITTYADRRLSQANVYTRAGFTYLYKTKPNYVYLDKAGKYCGVRQKYQKHKLNNLLPRFSKDLTESENMFSNGYRRLWDAGHHKLCLLLMQR